jgi:hypothetical protein
VDHIITVQLIFSWKWHMNTSFIFSSQKLHSHMLHSVIPKQGLAFLQHAALTLIMNGLSFCICNHLSAFRVMMLGLTVNQNSYYNMTKANGYAGQWNLWLIGGMVRSHSDTFCWMKSPVFPLHAIFTLVGMYIKLSAIFSGMIQWASSRLA